MQVEGLGPILTLAWPLRIGPAAGVLRVWVPEVLVALALVDDPPLAADARPTLGRFGGLATTWRIEAGDDRRRPGPPAAAGRRPLPIDGAPLRGTAAMPEGPMILTIGAGPSIHVIPP